MATTTITTCHLLEGRVVVDQNDAHTSVGVRPFCRYEFDIAKILQDEMQRRHDAAAIESKLQAHFIEYFFSSET